MSEGSGSDTDLEGVQHDIDDLDLLDYSSQSQSQMSDYGDSDQLLQHLSNSQQMREDELDRQDLLIKQEIAEEEERQKAMEDQKIIVNKHQRKPRVILALPPGLKVFDPDHPAAFTFSDLRLQEHFGWQGKVPLEEPEDEFLLVRYLVPEVSHNLRITKTEEFQSLVSFIFSMNQLLLSSSFWKCSPSPRLAVNVSNS